MKALPFLLLLLSVCSSLFGQIAVDSVAQVPEPGSILLLGTAAAGIGLVAWRRKK